MNEWAHRVSSMGVASREMRIGQEGREKLLGQLQRFNNAFANCFKKSGLEAPNHGNQLRDGVHHAFDQKRFNQIRVDVNYFQEVVLQNCLHPHTRSIFALTRTRIAWFH